MADEPDGCVPIQRDLEKLVKWLDRILYEIQNRKMKKSPGISDVPLGQRKPRKNTASCSRQEILCLCSVLVRHIWRMSGIDIIKQIQSRVMKMIIRLQHFSCEEILREVRLFESREEKAWGDSVKMPKYLMGLCGLKKTEPDSSKCPETRQERSGNKLKSKKLYLTFFFFFCWL